jgi:beta-barrel assembly-enhancing protease
VRDSFRTAVALTVLVSVVSGCRTLSVSEERSIGAQQQRNIRQTTTLLRDRVVVDYVRKLGEELARSSGTTPFELRFYVVEDESLNAFATFGGAIYIHSGIIRASNDVSELAGVIAHEIGHVTARHLAQNAERQRNTGIIASIVQLAILIFGGPVTPVAEELTELAALGYLNTFSREFEAQADTLAVQTLIKAGYDPEGMLRVFRTLQADQTGGATLRFLQDHPTSEERIRAVERQIAEAAAPEGRNDDRGRLEIIQARIELVAGTDSDLADEEDEELETGRISEVELGNAPLAQIP